MTALFFWTGVCVWACWIAFAVTVLIGETVRTYRARRRIHQAVRELIETSKWEWSAK